MKIITLEDALRRVGAGPLTTRSVTGGTFIESGSGIVATASYVQTMQGTQLNAPESSLSAALLAHAFNVLPEVVAAARALSHEVGKFKNTDPVFGALLNLARVLDKASIVEVPE